MKIHILRFVIRLMALVTFAHGKLLGGDIQKEMNNVFSRYVSRHALQSRSSSDAFAKQAI